jgi:hypothetical protein
VGGGTILRGWSSGDRSRLLRDSLCCLRKDLVKIFWLLAVVVIGLIIIQDSNAWSSRCIHPGNARLASMPREYPNFTRALKRHFKSEWRRAAITSWAEGGWNPAAKNGQYLGTFQMGNWARSVSGHSSNLIEQVRIAAKHRKRFGWGQWECAWYGN